MADVAFPWFGGKALLLPEILKFIPQHRTYVEVFGGSAAVLLAKDQAPVEIYNDLDSGLVNFFRVMRDPFKSRRLIEMCQLTPYAREEYNYARDHWGDEPDDLIKAYEWYIVARWSFSGVFGRAMAFDVATTAAGIAGRVRKWHNAIAKLPNFCNRILDVQVEHRDFREILGMYDRPETLFYLDPPYVPETRKDGEYAHELVFEDHVEMTDMLLDIQGMAILSGYSHKVYMPLEEAGWERNDYDTFLWSDLRPVGDNRPRDKRVESLWISPTCKARHKQMSLFA